MKNCCVFLNSYRVIGVIVSVVVAITSLPSLINIIITCLKSQTDSSTRHKKFLHCHNALIYQNSKTRLSGKYSSECD